MSCSWKRGLKDHLDRLMGAPDVVVSRAVKRASVRDLPRRIQKFCRDPRNRDRRGVRSEVNARIKKTLKHLRNAVGHAETHDDPEIRREARELIRNAPEHEFPETEERAGQFVGLLQKSGHRRAKQERRRAEQERKIEVHDRITNSVIAAIEAGAGSWQMPWHRGGKNLNRPLSVRRNRPYKGINRISLWIAAQERGFSTGIWGTRSAWEEKGCLVREDEQPSPVIAFVPSSSGTKANTLTGETDNTETSETERAYNGGRCIHEVFNADQVHGYKPPRSAKYKNRVRIVEKAKRFVAATRADIRHGGTVAEYGRAGDDIIRMPERELFRGSPTSTATEAYWSTLLHELVHWTGAKSRCKRRFGRRFGDDAYAMEELVAELGAAFLCADLGVTLEPRRDLPRRDHAQYIGSWLKVLGKDSEAIFTAAGRAQQAVDFLTDLQSAKRSSRTLERSRRPRVDWRPRGLANGDCTAGWPATA